MSKKTFFFASNCIFEAHSGNNSYMSCYLILRKWENDQLPAKKPVIKRSVFFRKESLIHDRENQKINIRHLQMNVSVHFKSVCHCNPM